MDYKEEIQKIRKKIKEEKRKDLENWCNGKKYKDFYFKVRDSGRCKAVYAFKYKNGNCYRIYIGVNPELDYLIKVDRYIEKREI